MNYYQINTCRASTGCKQSVVNPNNLIKNIETILKETDFNNKRSLTLNTPLKNHHLFKIGIAGCPNSCSQVQIKDLAFIGYIKPNLDNSLCIHCSRCINSCKENAINFKNNNLVINQDTCLGCGNCAKVCAMRAISLENPNWRVLVGGKLGRHARLAKEIGLFTEKEALEIVKKSIDLILNNKIPSKRIADILIENLTK